MKWAIERAEKICDLAINNNPTHFLGLLRKYAKGEIMWVDVDAEIYEAKKIEEKCFDFENQGKNP